MRLWATFIVGLLLTVLLVGFVQVPARGSTDLNWDCVYDVDWRYPENDPDCAWTISGAATRAIEANGDLLNMTTGISVTHQMDRSAIPFDSSTGFLVRARATLTQGTNGFVEVNYLAGNCISGVEWVRTAGNVRLHYYYYTSVTTLCDTNLFGEITDIADTGFVELEFAVGPLLSDDQFTMTMKVEGVVKNQLTMNFLGGYPNDVQWGIISALSSPNSFVVDYVAYKLAITNPTATRDLYPMPHVNPRPYPAGTRAEASSPFWSLLYDWRDTDAATGASFYLPYPLGEDSVRIRRDVLYVDKSQNANRLWINDTKSTSSTADDTILWYATTSLVFLDLTSLSTTTDGENLTLQEGSGSIAFRTDRETQVDLARGFNWSLTGSQNERSFVLTVTNNATRTWYNAWFHVPFAVDTDAKPSSVTVFDHANNQYLDSGLHYTVTGGAVEWEVSTIAADISRTWTVTYTDWSTAESGLLGLEATTAVPDSSFTGIAFRARVSHQQTASASFSGDIVVRMNVQDPSFAGRVVDMGSLVVVDVRTGMRVTNWIPHPIQVNVFVMPDQSIPAGAVQQYDIYFAYTQLQGGGVGSFLGSEWGILAFLVLFILALIFGIDSARARLKKGQGGGS